MGALIRKDLRIFFASPLAYVTLALFLFLTSFAFSSQLMQMTPGQLPEASMRGMMYFVAVILLFLTPLLTMRSFAEESQQQTMELLKTAPVSDWQIVFAKFVSAWTMVMVMVLGTLIYPLIMFLFAKPDLGPMVMAYLGLCLMVSALVSVGVLASSLVRSPMLAALISFVALLLLWFLGGLENAWAEQLSIIRHLENFSIGVFDFSDAGYYVLFSGALFFITVRWQEASRWK